MLGRRRVGPGALGALLVTAWVVILALYMTMHRASKHMLHLGLPHGEDAQDTASEPLAPNLAESLAALHTFAPMRPNLLPLYDIAVGMCYPLFGCALPKQGHNPEAGDWVRVDRPVHASVAQWRGRHASSFARKPLSKFGTPYFFYRRARTMHGRHIADMKFVEASTPLPAGDGWRQLSVPRPKFSRKRTKYALHVRTVHNATDPITELDVMYGPNQPPPGFVVAGSIPAFQGHGKHAARTSVIVRRTPKPTPRAPPLRFDASGTFTILQLADLHFSVEELACRDVEDVHRCASQNDTNALIERWIDEEKPDLVVFTGDQLNGQGTSWDEQSVMPGWLLPVVRRGIPWLPLFGNHDTESGYLTRREQMELLALYPYSLAQVGPTSIHGAGNFDVAVRAPAPSNEELLTLWCLDSGAHPPFSLLHPWDPYLYDWVHTDQIQWLVKQLRRKMRIAWPYKPRPPPFTSTLVPPHLVMPHITHVQRPPGIVFVHIPIQEAFDAVDVDENGDEMRFGVREERFSRLGGQGRRGLFDALERERNDDTPGVQLYVHGHMHNNEDCRRVRGHWICFGGGVSYAGYGKVGFARRARVYQARGFGQTLVTWHRMDDREGRVEERVLR